MAHDNTNPGSGSSHFSRRSSRWRRRLIFGFVVLCVAVAGLLTVPSLRWRVQLLRLQTAGAISDVEWSDVWTFIEPGSRGYNNLARLIETRNPHAVVLNPRKSAEDIRAGMKLFGSQCSACHGAAGAGGEAPPLIEQERRHAHSDWALFRTIRFGIPGTGMQAHALSFEQLWQLVAYVQSLESGQATGQPVRVAINSVSYEELRNVTAPGADWLTYSGSYDSQRHSTLTQIDRTNVHQLAVRWIHQFEGDWIKVETSPIVRDGVLFTTLADGTVLALDASTGVRLWRYGRNKPAVVRGGEYGPYNRGVALLDDKVFVGTADAHLIALSSSDGKPIWDVQVGDPHVYAISAAPLAYRDLVVTGVAVPGKGRGFVVALDANTGAERWRFTTIPGPGETGNETWKGESWRVGGAPTWMTGSYDAERDLLVWGAGNPKPDYDAAVRAGDNLYSNSALGLRGTTGELIWHFQFTPADDKDHDSGQVPVLADVATASGPAARVLWANRNGFYYVLDRETGRYLTSAPLVHQTWTRGIDASGRPMTAGMERPAEGVVIHPGNVGGTNWWPPSYDAENGLFFVPVLEQGMVFFSSQSSWPKAMGKPLYTAIRALDAATGKMVWQHKREPRHGNPAIGGLLTTKSGLLFAGDLAEFFALDAKTGQHLWEFEAGGTIGAAPVTYAVNGVQYVAISAGGDLLAFALPEQSRLTGAADRPQAEDRLIRGAALHR